MAIDLTGISELSDAPPPNPEEELAEAKAHGFETVKEFYDHITAEYDKQELWEADPNCVHDIQSAPGGGVKCTKCRGWFCY